MTVNSSKLVLAAQAFYTLAARPIFGVHLNPPHAVLYLFPVTSFGAVLSWLLVLHVIVAGLFAYLYARAEGLQSAPSLVVAFGYMFAGKWMYHLLGGGHYVTIGLAWLPLVLLCLRCSIRQGSLIWSTLAGVSFAMIILSTHPQWTFYCGLFVLLWTVILVLDAAGCLRDGGTPIGDWRTIGKFASRGVVMGAWLVVVAIGLTAIQLLPTIEAAQQSTRGHVGISAEGKWLATSVVTLMRLVGPRLNDPWVRADIELQGAISYLWLVVASWALDIGDRRLKAWLVCFLLLVLFAVGGANLVQDLPGFRLFRIPSRMLLIATLPLALVVGGVTDRLMRLASVGEIHGVAWKLAKTSFVVLLLTTFVSILEVRLFLNSTSPYLSLHPYWLAFPWLLLVGIGLMWSFVPNNPRWQCIWVALLLVDITMMSRTLVATRTYDQVYPSSKSIEFLSSATKDHSRVLDRDLSTARVEIGQDGKSHQIESVLRGTGPLDHGWPLAAEIPALRGYNPLDVQRYQQFMKFISDSNQPPLPDVGFYHLPTVNRKLLNLLGTRYLLQPSSERTVNSESASSLPAVMSGAPWEALDKVSWIAPPRDEVISEETGWIPRLKDPSPQVYAYVQGGVRNVGPFTIYENQQAMQRAFWVPTAVLLPKDEDVLPALRENDFSQRVFLEGDFPVPSTSANASALGSSRIDSYAPNRIRIRVNAVTDGYLVLTDPWFPGWKCTVDGKVTPIYRANYAFRGIAVPAGEHEVEFLFAPDSFEVGKTVSVVSIALVLIIIVFGFGWSQFNRARSAESG